LMADATLGTGGALLIEGEAGIGKSRFLYECARLRSAAGVISVGRAGDALKRLQPVPRRPVAVFLDDLHESEASDLAAFSSLLALTERLRVAIVASYSSEMTTANLASEIVRWREAGAAHLRLPALRDAETELLIRSAAPRGKSPSSELLRAMLRSAQGNPRVAVELAESLANDAGGAPIAPSAAAAVTELREQLAPEAFEVLRLCSVVGDAFRDTWIVDLAR